MNTEIAKCDCGRTFQREVLKWPKTRKRNRCATCLKKKRVEASQKQGNKLRLTEADKKTRRVLRGAAKAFKNSNGGENVL